MLPAAMLKLQAWQAGEGKRRRAGSWHRGGTESRLPGKELPSVPLPCEKHEERKLNG